MKRVAPFAILTLALAVQTGAARLHAQEGRQEVQQQAQENNTQAGPQKPGDGRFSMLPGADGFVRLDTRTGAVSHCVASKEGVKCRAGADERAALDAEIERLAKDNADLRAKLAAATDQAPFARLRNALPTDEEVNRAMGWMETFMRRMMRIMRDESPPGERL